MSAIVVYLSLIRVVTGSSLNLKDTRPIKMTFIPGDLPRMLMLCVLLTYCFYLMTLNLLLDKSCVNFPTSFCCDNSTNTRRLKLYYSA